MRPLSQGESEKFSLPIRCAYGRGEVIVTSFGLAVHTAKSGSVLDLLYPEITRIERLGSGLLALWWREPDGSEAFLELRVPQEHQAYERLLAAQAEFDATAAGAAAYEDRRAGALAGPAGSAKGPEAAAPEETVWNDCRYDAARQLFITTNPYFVQNEALRKRPHQIRYEAQSGDGEGIVAAKDGVRMVFGYPAVPVREGREVFLMMLPSFTEEMITADIAAARHVPAAGQMRIDFYERPAGP